MSPETQRHHRAGRASASTCGSEKKAPTLMSRCASAASAASIPARHFFAMPAMVADRCSAAQCATDLRPRKDSRGRPAGADRKTLLAGADVSVVDRDRIRRMVPVRAGAAQGHACGGAPRSEEKGGAAVNESERRDQRIENTLFYVSLFSYAYFYQASDQSTAARFDLIRSVLERRTLWIDGFCGYNTADIINIGDHYYSVKAPGTSLTGLLPWSLISWFLSLPLAAQHEPLMWAIATYLTILISISLPVALLVVVMYRFGKALGATPGRSAAIALIMAFATILFPYATEMTGEPVAAVCLMTSFYLIFTAAKQPDASARGFRGIPRGMGGAGRFSERAGRGRDRTLFAAQASEMGACVQLCDRRRHRRRHPDALQLGRIRRPVLHELSGLQAAAESAVPGAGGRLRRPHLSAPQHFMERARSILSADCFSAIRSCCWSFPGWCISGAAASTRNFSSCSKRSSHSCCSTHRSANRSCHGAAAPRPARGR